MAEVIHHDKRRNEVEKFNRERLIKRSLRPIKAWSITRLCGHVERHSGLSRARAEAFVFTECDNCEESK